MKNSAKASYKFSQLEIASNTSILLILACQVVLASIGALTGATWNTNNQDVTTYMGTTEVPEADKHGFGYYLITMIGTWVLIFTNFVPISMMVSLDWVKLLQGNFMQDDATMFDKEQDMETKAQSSNLNEELGQVEYVFSDKTGTLTCNIMEFKKFTAGKRFYGLDQKPTTKQLSNVSFHDPAMFEVLENESDPDHQSLARCLMFLSLCHTIIIDKKNGNYNASSPDELALAHFAK